jgi:hypothetical protein
MNHIIWHLRVKCIGVAALALGCTLPVHADWSDNFNGGFQQSWQFGNVETSSTFSAGVVNDQLVLTDTTDPDFGGAKTGFGVVFQNFTDVRMTGIINPSGNENINDSVGLLIRGNFLNQSFYMAEINYTDRQLIIYRNGGPGNGNLVTEPIEDLQFTDSVYVEIEAIGDNLEVWAYDAPGGNLWATASVVDSSFASGIAGVIVDENFGGLPILGVWDDLTVEAIVPDIDPDFDGDGDVDGADFLLWQRGGTPSPLSPDELAAWQSDFGTLPSTGLSAVPEPSALLLVGSLAMLSLVRRSRRLRF